MKNTSLYLRNFKNTYREKNKNTPINQCEDCTFIKIKVSLLENF